MAVVVWQFSDWITLTGAAAQRAQLVLHIQEITDRISQNQETDLGEVSGKRFNVDTYLERLERKLERFDKVLGTGIQGSLVHFSRGVAPGV